MSFERTKGSIQNLSGTAVNASDLMEMLVCVAQDIFEQSNVKKPSLLSLGDPDVLVDNMYSMIQMILAVHSSNKARIDSLLSAEDQSTMEALSDCNNEVQKQKENVAEVESRRNELSTARDNLERERGHLLALKDECSDLEQRIIQLKDTALDALPEKKKALSSEISELAAQRTIILNAINSAKNDALLSKQLFVSGGEGGLIHAPANPDIGIFQRELRSWDDLDRWFEAISQRVSALLEASTAVLNSIVERAEALTAEPKEE